MGVDPGCGYVTIGREQVCTDDPCLDRITSLVRMCEFRQYWYMRGVGWLMSTTDASQEPLSTIFTWIVWYRNPDTGKYSGWLHILDCDCYDQEVAYVSDLSATPNSPAVFGYQFVPSPSACETGCESVVMALMAQAITNGWEVLGEGVILKRTSEQYSCYRFDTGVVKTLFCVDTGHSFVYITCSCYRAEITEDYSLRAFVPCSVCVCFDMRELILSYPEMFGLVDVSFGEDTVYTVDRSSSGGSIETRSCLRSGSLGWDVYSCDYRSMYAMFDNTCIGMPYRDGVDDMFFLEFNTSGEWWDSNWNTLKYEGVTGGVMYFDGHIPPFTTIDVNRATWPHAGDKMEWKGLTIRWTAGNSNEGMTETFWSESDAETRLAEIRNSANPYGSDQISPAYTNATYFYPPAASTGPSSGYEVYEGEVTAYPEGSENPEYYIVHYPCHRWTRPYVFNLNFAMTNKGFLVNGRSGWSDTLAVPGYVGSIPYNYPDQPTEQELLDNQWLSTFWTRCELPTPPGQEWDPGEGICPAGTVKEVDFTTGIASVPFYDMSFRIRNVDDSMHGCEDEDWWDPIINPEDTEDPEDPGILDEGEGAEENQGGCL
jgi:hypothetical protein